MGTDTDHLDLPLRHDFTDDGDDLGRPDIETHDQILFSLLWHASSVPD
jgi:hypothetical protein